MDCEKQAKKVSDVYEAPNPIKRTKWRSTPDTARAHQTAGDCRAWAAIYKWWCTESPIRSRVISYVNVCNVYVCMQLGNRQTSGSWIPCPWVMGGCTTKFSSLWLCDRDPGLKLSI
jgi:hypothetical protein